MSFDVIKNLEYYFGKSLPNDQIYFIENIDDFIDYKNNEKYYIKIKCKATNGLNAYILIGGFEVYCMFKICEEGEKSDSNRVKKILNILKRKENNILLDDYLRKEFVKDIDDINGKKGYYLKVYFKNHIQRKRIIYKIRELQTKDKSFDYQLCEDDVSIPYYIFIACRTKIKIKEEITVFPLVGVFKLKNKLDKDEIYKNIYHYKEINFVDNNIEPFIEMVWDIESYNKKNLDIEDSKYRVFPLGNKDDQAFMIVYCFYKGRGKGIKPFHIITLLLKEADMPLEYTYEEENLYKIYVEDETNLLLAIAYIYRNFNPDRVNGWNCLGYDWPFLLRKLYKLKLLEKFFFIATGKQKKLEEIIKYYIKQENITIYTKFNTAKHIYLKIDGVNEYDAQSIFRQHFKNLTKYSLNLILSLLDLEPKDDLDVVTEMHEILLKTRDNLFKSKEEKIQSCNKILKYCIRDCQAVKEMMEHVDKWDDFKAMCRLTNIPYNMFAKGSKTQMINSALSKVSIIEGFNIVFRFFNMVKAEKFGSGFVKEPSRYRFSLIPWTVVDFNSLYPSVIKQRNIDHSALKHELETFDKEEDFHNISFENDKNELIMINIKKD